MRYIRSDYDAAVLEVQKIFGLTRPGHAPNADHIGLLSSILFARALELKDLRDAVSSLVLQRTASLLLEEPDAPKMAFVRPGDVEGQHLKAAVLRAQLVSHLVEITGMFDVTIDVTIGTLASTAAVRGESDVVGHVPEIVL